MLSQIEEMLRQYMKVGGTVILLRLHMAHVFLCYLLTYLHLLILPYCVRRSDLVVRLLRHRWSCDRDAVPLLHLQLPPRFLHLPLLSRSREADSKGSRKVLPLHRETNKQQNCLAWCTECRQPTSLCDLEIETERSCSYQLAGKNNCLESDWTPSSNHAQQWQLWQ